MSRAQNITTKVETDFGKIYVHVDYTNRGIVGVAFSQPGKLENSTVGKLLDQLTRAVDESMGEVRTT